ncbi:cytochrome P450 [Streptomyces sp. N2A]|uniref:cytochrome P450 n=1 Tax=Streptomyces sp. N2A TaxID=3073936 RepID=UPI00286FF666|nr:cytochrome P450 [Streptomyces sp. N2A]
MIHYDGRWFTEPERFTPDRWLPKKTKQLPRNAHIPYDVSAGSETTRRRSASVKT